jgi:hypothetical protein
LEAPEIELAERERTIDVFQEIYKLLEDYAPAWYSEELHGRTEAALRIFGRGNKRQRPAEHDG